VILFLAKTKLGRILNNQQERISKSTATAYSEGYAQLQEEATEFCDLKKKTELHFKHNSE